MAWVTIANVRGPRGTVGPAGPGMYLGTANAQFGDIRDLKTMGNGFVSVGDYLAADGLGLPESVGGIVWSITHNATNVQQQFSTAHLDGAHLWSRKKTGATTWTSWRRIDAGRPPRTLPSGADLNTYFGEDFIGQWRVTSTTAAATMFNLPKDSLGRQTTSVIDVTGPYGFQTARVYNADGAPLIFYRARTTHDATIVDAWTEWVSLTGASDGSSLANVAQDNKARVDAYTRARGGSIGTDGLAAVALRFDHNLANFRDIILPLLRARNLPWSQAVNTSQNHIDAPANGGVTWAQLQGWALNDGGEILAHSHTHADSVGSAAIVANVVDSIPVFKSGMPQLVVEGFAPPGAGGTNWAGFLDTLTPEHFTSKYDGAGAVLKNFAFCAGYIPGALRPLSGQLTNGQTHITMDNTTSASSVTSVLQQAQQMGAGVQLMMHPNMLTLDGRITTTVLTQIFDWIVSERDAGRLVVLTTSGLLVADARTSYRYNVLRGFGTSVWTNTTGWTIAGSTATGLSNAGVMSGSVSLANLGHITGRVRELVVEARSTSGATLRMGVDGSPSLSVAKGIAVPSGNTWRTYRIPFTIPATASSLTLSLGRLSGGAMDMRNPSIQAV